MVRGRSRLDEWLSRAFGDDQPKRFGTGWASGTLSVFCGVLALGAVACLHYPALLTHADLRGHYPMPVVRALVQIVIGTAFLLGVLAAVLRHRNPLGLVGIGLSLTASLLGGASVPVDGPVTGRLALGLDWFLLNLLLLAVMFVPLERTFPRRPEQGVFRPGWTTDTLHFFVSHLLVQLVTLLTVMPAALLVRAAGGAWLQSVVRAQPLVLQWAEIVLVADLTQYAVHRLFHAVPLLWRFHAVHHSSVALDWLAGSRLHLVDVLVTRSCTLVPIVLLGFAPVALYAYVVFVSFHAVLIHGNLRGGHRWMERLVVLPRFHHWHHAAAAEAVDKNFAVHIPWIDRLFGTHYLPGARWPEVYGIAGDPVPAGYVAQLLAPFRRYAREAGGNSGGAGA